MSKRAIKEGGYPLPDQIDGYTEFVCYRVDVPNSLEYRAAFLGALAELTKWWNWEKSGQPGDTRATRAASYWRELLLEFPDCEASLFDIRQKPDFPCIIQKAYDGVTWQDAVYINRCPVKIRINAGIVQWFDPVGGVWQPVEGGGDERTDGEAPAPWPVGELPPGEDGACLSAENITAFYQTALTQVRGEVALGTQVTAMAAGLTGLASLFMPGALFATIALALCAAALDLGVAGLDDMLTQSHLDDLKCVIYRNAESDGSITSAGYSAIYSEVGSYFGGAELSIIRMWLDGYGSVGLTRQGKAEGITTGNCGSCNPPTGQWRVFAEGSPDDTPNTTPLAITNFGAAWSSPYGVMIDSGLPEVTQVTGTIPEYGGGTVYHLATAVCDLSSLELDQLGTFPNYVRIFIRRENSNQFGANDAIIYSRLRTTGGGSWVTARTDVTSTPIGVDTMVVALGFDQAGLDTYDKILYEVSSYCEYTIVKVEVSDT